MPRGGSAKPGSAGQLLHLDAFSGIAGNMLLGALLDLGLSRRALEQDLAGIDVAFGLRVRRVRRGALGARRVDVQVPGARGRRPRAATHAHGRSYLEIVRLLERAKLEPDVRARALAIFAALGRAEARVHGIDLEKVHFHEVGAVDAIVDVAGAAIGLQRLGVARVTASPVPLGHGQVETAHGRLPLPAPATLELLRDIPTVPAHVPWETVTPTGAAILRTVVEEFRTLPAMIPTAIGIGAGDDREGPMPNVLRAILGRQGGPAWDRIVEIETNLDDLVPEHFEYVMERLFDHGALDVSIQHIQMKKNRPGFLLRVLARPSDRQKLAAILFGESTAIGVRMRDADRLVLERESRRVETPYGRIAVKVVRDADGRSHVSAEYDDCKRAARRTGVPLREVLRAAERAAGGT
ncbi:MAG: nickel pincer cofactor biosynthesis protein LarC [Deltaproteobacteria bacterium]|nr:MAG: nickel pincer cofactor biosynthesis protein LarC [Deltaproteobacteria bacterium]